MAWIALFFGGLFLANGIPHFLFGIAGREFFTPFIHRWLAWVPNPLFNVCWGLLNFILAFTLLRVGGDFTLDWNWPSLVVALGFAFAAIGLSIYFPRRAKRENSST